MFQNFIANIQMEKPDQPLLSMEFCKYTTRRLPKYLKLYLK